MSEQYNIADYGLHPQLPSVFDATMISDWHDCKSMFYLRHVLGLKKLTAVESNDLNWGSMWHRLLHAYHTNSHNAVQAAAVLKDWPSGLDETEPFNRTRDRMLLCFTKYLAQFKEQDEEEVENLRHEQYFDIFCPENNPACPFGGCGLRWCGRMDRLVRRRNKILVWDYKTTRRMGVDYFDHYEHSFQIPGYVWAAKHLMTEPIEGAVLDVMYVLTKSEDPFRRTFKYSDERLLEWRYNVKTAAAEISHYWTNFPDQPELWPKDWNNCTRYGKCAYADVHFAAPIRDSRLRIISEDYMEERWNPSSID
jgi:hypothetical protein